MLRIGSGKTALGWRWKDPEHITILESRALFSSLRWRLRRGENQRTRFLHLVDSQAVLGAATKGRSSSRQLAAVLERLSALVLASGVVMFLAYVNTKTNPADRPSRWFSWK